MARLGIGRSAIILWGLVAAAVCVAPLTASAQAADFKTFRSDEFGFSMKFPTSWVKIDQPQGNYYVVFQAPDLVDNFRSRIHVAAHKPVKDSLEVFLTEMRNGIKDLQRQAPSGAKGQEVRIIDEGEFKCEVPGAYFFFIQAYEEKLNIWMGIVIVFYKHDKTLLRISCLAPYERMDQFHQVFNTSLLSVKFDAGPSPEVAPSRPTAVPPPSPGTAPPAIERRPSPSAPEVLREQPAPAPRIEPTAPAPRAVPPRGPARLPDRGPSTGIVE